MILTSVLIAQQLLKDLNDAKSQYVEKRDHFAGLCQLNSTKVLKWTAIDRSPRVDPRNKRTVLSVYSHNNEKGMLFFMSQLALQSMFNSTNPQGLSRSSDEFQRLDSYLIWQCEGGGSSRLADGRFGNLSASVSIRLRLST